MKSYSPDVIDAALESTLKMLARGKAVVWQGSRMYRTYKGICINGAIVGREVEAVFFWFQCYSPADPYLSGWGADEGSMELLRRFHDFY
jgi:hypothetical protein